MAAVAGKKSAPAQVHHLAKTISAHCFNWDRSQLAFCPNNGEVHIYADCHKPSSKEWCVPDDKGADGDGKSGYDPKLGVAGKPYYNLKKHSLVVTGIDWHPTTNKIVTCSQDRNAFVWDYNTEENVWEPAAVVLRFPRAAVQVRWSPDGRKFAVAGAARIECVDGEVVKTQGNLAVCHYEKSNKWWIAKPIKKKVKSTVMCVGWHPSGQILAAGMTDCTCRVFGAFVKKVDEPTETMFGVLGHEDFGTLLAQFNNAGGWVESVAWSPSGWKMGFASHDSSVTFVHFYEDSEKDPPLYQQIKNDGLPFTQVLFLADDKCVAMGHELNPHLYSANEEGIWALETTLDNSGSGDGAKKKSNTQFGKAMSMWGGKKLRSSSDASGGGKNEINTKHDRPIFELRPYAPTIAEEGDAGGKVTKFTSVGMDGKLVVWDVSDFV